MTDLHAAPSFEALDDHQGTTFTVSDADADLELELTEIDTTFDTAEDWERFTLVFDGPGDTVLDDDLYRLENDGGDRFDVSLSATPTMNPDTERVQYEVAFTRQNPGREPGRARGRGPANAGNGASVGAPQLAANPVLGGIELFGGKFAPVGFSKCSGQRIPISQNEALYSLLGTKYGGQGRQTFGLPDLRGRVPISAGRGGSRSQRKVGEAGGSETVALSQQQLAPHNHALQANLPVSKDQADSRNPNGNRLGLVARGGDGVDIYTDGDANGKMDVDGTVGRTGDGRPHDNMPPFLTVTYVIAVQGVYPSHS
ncbi:phage tail protein [Halorussus amylolyticus]|uniref:phage tail protein n=1 Tax=Halorussus amylolyticus TaxID=1126242 RepID=UPI0010445482|nr:tail fiber protein [Halorussus amylolyticus]